MLKKNMFMHFERHFCQEKKILKENDMCQLYRAYLKLSKLPKHTYFLFGLGALRVKITIMTVQLAVMVHVLFVLYKNPPQKFPNVCNC